MRLVGLFLFLFSQTVMADELKLHFIKSPLGINWKSPWTLAVTTIQNQLIPVKKWRSYPISHVFVEVKCDSLGQHIYRGMTSESNNEERDLIFKKKYGLGTMFHFFNGYLEKDDEVVRDLAEINGKKRKSSLSIKVSSETCQRLLDYAYEYEDLGYGKMYSGLQGDPLKREGAGCSAFGVSFMRIAGLMDEFTDEWKTIIDVPHRFIGGPMTGNKVGLGYILQKTRAKWSNKEPHVHLEAWNPELMHAWVKKTYNKVKDGTYEGPWSPKISKYKNSLHVELNMEDRETPEGEFWIE